MRKFTTLFFLTILSQFAFADVIEDANIARDAYDNEDYSKAFLIYKTLAGHGEGPAQFVIAEMIEKGQGTEKNAASANEWRLKAERNGITTAKMVHDAWYNPKTLRKAALKKEREEIKRAETKRLAAEEQRKSTPEYKQQKAIETINDAKFRIKAAQKAIDHENRIGERTGYVNKGRIYEAGSYLIAYEDVLDQSYENYKEAGGKLRLRDIK